MTDKREFLRRNDMVQEHLKRIAGCCAKTAVAPLDRVKILLQAHNQHYKHLGVFSTVRHVIRKEGFLGLYQGNGVQMLRIFPYAAIQFLSYEHFKQICKQNIQWLNQYPNISKLFSGSLAVNVDPYISEVVSSHPKIVDIPIQGFSFGLTAVLVTYPLDMIRARLAFQVKGETIYDGIVHTVKSIRLLEGGTRGLYQGIVPTILGMAPYAGLSFSSFEMLKNFALDTFPEVLGKPQNSGGIVLILPAKLLCGGLAGAIAQTVSYPLDVVRRRMQISGMIVKPPTTLVSSSRGWLQVMIDVYHESGMIKGLFRGMSINYIRIMPTVAISFATYESCKQAFGLDTGVDR